MSFEVGGWNLFWWGKLGEILCWLVSRNRTNPTKPQLCLTGRVTNLLSGSCPQSSPLILVLSWTMTVRDNFSCFSPQTIVASPHLHYSSSTFLSASISSFLITVFELEVGRFYGDGTKYKAVWGRMNQINQNAKALTAAVAAGVDPITVELNDGPYVPQKSRPKGQGKMDTDFRSFICSLHTSRFHCVGQ